MIRLSAPKLHSEFFFNVFLVLFWGQDTTFRYLRAVFLRIPYVKLAADYYLSALMILCLVLALPVMLRSISVKDLLYLIIICVVFLLQTLIFPANSEYLLSISGDLFLSVLPMYLVGLLLKEEKHLRILYIASIVNMCTFAFYVMTSGGGAQSDHSAYSGYMSRAYTLLPQLLVIVGYSFKKANVFNIILSIAGSILLFMCGNRGTVLILCVFLIMALLFMVGKRLRRSAYMLFTLAGVLLLSFYREVLGFISICIQKMGMSARVLNYITVGGLFESRGRTVISRNLLKMICEKPLVGYGLAADHVATGSYAHNFLLELWTSFGVVCGSALFIAVVCIIIKAWKRNKDSVLLSMFICAGFLKLFISSSYLLEGLFFALLGYCTALNRQGKMSVN